MIKAFISHSSAQKGFVKRLVDILGRDYCIVDCYDFEPAYKTIDEIYRKINQSTVFVLLLSREALSSEWVTKEIRYAKTKLQPEDYNRFWPFIIDGSLNIGDCPEWMKSEECFNLKKFDSPKMLARDIEQKFRRIIWSEDSQRKQLDTIMVGRNSDIDKFEDIYQSARGLNLRTLIISGRDGVGKDMFISKCINKMGYDIETVPFLISLEAKEGIENYIVQLNLIMETYDEDQLMDILRKDPTEKSKIAAEMTNKLLLSKTILVIDDNLACVQPNRKLADWLTDMVENSSLEKKLGIFIKSKKMPGTFIDVDHPLFSHLHLDPLEEKDRSKLFYSLLRIYGIVDVSDNDVSWFVKKLLLSPYQLVKAVEALSKQPMRIVKKDIADLMSWGDKRIKPTISYFFGDEIKRQILVILSKIDFVSYDIFESFFRDDIEIVMKYVDEMMDYGIVTVFGPNEEFFRLDHYFSDYIKRCRITLSSDLEALFSEILEAKIADSPNITEDASVYLYEKKQIIMSGRGNTSDFLIPSVVINAVMEIYNRQDYKQVINVCDKVLSDVHNYFVDQERELRYWLCLSLARIVMAQRFYEEIKYFSSKDTDYYFLRGFYHRNAMEYSQAELFFNKALQKSPQLQRAKREKVTALLAQKKFDEALELARENYESNPENSYQIHGYFRCLVRKKVLTKEDKSILKSLMDAMRENLSDKHEELYVAMDIEYQDNVNHQTPEKMLEIINDAESRFPKSQNVKRAAQFFKYRQSIIQEEKIFPEDCSSDM